MAQFVHRLLLFVSAFVFIFISDYRDAPTSYNQLTSRVQVFRHTLHFVASAQFLCARAHKRTNTETEIHNDFRVSSISFSIRF